MNKWTYIRLCLAYEQMNVCLAYEQMNVYQVVLSIWTNEQVVYIRLCLAYEQMNVYQVV